MVNVLRPQGRSWRSGLGGWVGYGILGVVVALVVMYPLALGLAASDLEPSAVEPIALEPVVLQLKWKHQFQFAGYYAAQQQGFYRDAGLDVTIVEAPDDGSPPAQRVLKGQADFGVAASDLVLLRSRHLPVVALAAIFQHSPLVFLSVPESGISSVHDLAGRRIMLESHAEELLAYLQYEAVPTDGITFLPHTFNPQDLISGRVEAMSAYSTDEPFKLHEQGRAYSVFTPRAAGIDFYGDTLFTTEAYIQQHPDRVKRFLEASLQGWDYAMAHPEELIEVIYRDYSQRHSRDHLAFEAQKMQSLVLPEVVEIGYMNPGRWRHIADTYADLGMAMPGLVLDGFIYDRHPRPDLTWVYRTLLGAAMVLGIALWVAHRFYRLHRIIKQKMLETEQMATELAAFEQQYRVLVEHAPFAIVITSPADGTVLYINPKAATTFTIDQDHAKGNSALDYYANSGDRQIFLEALQRQGYVQNFEVVLKTAMGHPFWANLSATMIKFGRQPAIFTALLDVSAHKDMETKLKQMAMTDELTGLFNRRHFTQQGAQEIRLAQRSGVALALLLLDIDHFKAINDTYGHKVGDHVLQTLAQVIGRNVRDTDTVGRLGGEEFAVLLPNTDLAAAAVMAERLRCHIEAALCQVEDRAIQITASIGVSGLNLSTDTLDTLLNQADQAMYDAKHQGRNQVAFYAPDRGVVDALHHDAKTELVQAEPGQG